MGPREIAESLFNVGYTAGIWVIAGLMIYKAMNTKGAARALVSVIAAAFTLLALGDTGHVISRVAAYLMGGADAVIQNSGGSFSVVGIGRLTTSVTVTVFYGLFVEMWRLRYNRRFSAFYWALQGIGLFRLILMICPMNRWGAVVSPSDWSLYRNLPLLAVGIAVIILFLLEGYRKSDKPFIGVGYAVLISFGFYLPVILWVDRMPMIGLLMIPKTLAYLAAAVILYKGFSFFEAETSGGSAQPAGR